MLDSSESSPSEGVGGLGSGMEDARIRVLLVDDQVIVAEALRRMLADEPYIDYQYCNDPGKALEVAAEFKPTVILQDLVMPDIDGLMLLKFFRSNEALKSIPVIVLSTKEDPKIKSEAFELDAADYLVKFPDKIEVIARIRAHSRSYLAQQKLLELQRELEEKNAELERLSSLDGLTGIFNRRVFDEFIDNEWARAARDQRPISLILIDIDHFKTYNDNYGHQGGDDCLRQVAHTLAASVRRPSDIVARYGGEEFVVVMPGTTLEGAITIAEALRTGVDALKLSHEYSSTSDHVTISLGVASMEPGQNNVPKQLIEKADGALYDAKEAGRNRYNVAE